MASRPRFSCAEALGQIEDATFRERAMWNHEMLSRELHDRYGLDMRDDSRFAYNFSVGAVMDSVDDVTAEIAIMQWLSDTTPYQRVCEESMRVIAARSKQRYGLRDWSRTWQIVRLYVPELLKLHLIDQVGGVPNLARCTN